MGAFDDLVPAGNSSASVGAFDDLVPAGTFANGPLKLGADNMQKSLRDVLANTDWGTRNIAGIGSAVAQAWQGLTGEDKNSQDVQNQRTIANAAPVGNVAGNVAMLAPTALLPGANTVTGAATIGAITNALTTPGDLTDRANAAIVGAAGSGIGAGLSKELSSVSKIGRSPDAAALASEGVSLTPGQNAGGFLKNLEDKATSIPVLGNIINNARTKGIEDFNTAAINRATLPGMQVNGVGASAVQDLRQGLGDAYDKVLGTSSANALDPTFVQNMASLRSMVAAMPPKEAAMFDSVINREIGDRMAPNGMVNAENLQAVKSGLGQQATNFSSSMDGYQRQLGQALKQADSEFQDLIRRANPQNADDLKAIDTAYANFKRIQRAASGVGADNGVFTPAQLNSAVRALDKTKDKRAFSEGTSTLQDLATAGKNVLPNKVPDSGTASRLLANLFSLGGLASTAGGVATAIPAYLAYSRPGSAAINAVVNRGIKPAAEGLRSLSANNPNALRIGGMTLAELMRQKSMQPAR